MVQFIGIPFAFLFGGLASRIGAKRSVFLALAVYAGVSVLGYYMKTAAHFIALAVLVGMVQGGCQALSRSLFASMIPRHRSAEFFAFFAVFGEDRSPASSVPPSSPAPSPSPVPAATPSLPSLRSFSWVGGLLAFVNVPEGQRLAREAERAFSDSAQ